MYVSRRVAAQSRPCLERPFLGTSCHYPSYNRTMSLPPPPCAEALSLNQVREFSLDASRDVQTKWTGQRGAAQPCCLPKGPSTKTSARSLKKDAREGILCRGQRGENGCVPSSIKAPQRTTQHIMPKKTSCFALLFFHPFHFDPLPLRHALVGGAKRAVCVV